MHQLQRFCLCTRKPQTVQKIRIVASRTGTIDALCASFLTSSVSCCNGINPETLCLATASLRHAGIFSIRKQIMSLNRPDYDHTKLPTWCTEYYLFVKYYYSPLHVSSIKYSSSGGHSCTQAAYGTVTLCKSPSVLFICSYRENSPYSCISTRH